MCFFSRSRKKYCKYLHRTFVVVFDILSHIIEVSNPIFIVLLEIYVVAGGRFFSLEGWAAVIT